MLTPHRQARAFTLTELVVVIVILGILAAVAVPKFTFGTPATGTSGPRTGHAPGDGPRPRRGHTPQDVVEFYTSSDWYGVYIESPASPGRANRIWVAHPVTGASQFRVDLDDGDFADVTFQSASFGGRSEVEFDRFGTPYNGLDVALASDGTVVLVAGADTRTVRVVAETGLVEEE